jgi:hypothetical protein
MVEMARRLHLGDCVCTGARHWCPALTQSGGEISLRPVNAMGSQTRERRQASSATLRRHHRQLISLAPLSSIGQRTSGTTMMQSISGTLKSDLSTKYSKVGDPVEIEVTKDARRLYFEALFVDYTRLLGTVTMVRPASKTQPAALAIRVTEARSKKGTITLNGILGNPVIVKHKYMWLPDSVAISGGESHYSFNGVQPDPRFGSALNSTDDLFLEKGQAELEIVFVPRP